MFRGCDFAQLFYDFDYSLTGLSFAGNIYDKSTKAIVKTFQFTIDTVLGKLLVKLPKTDTELLAKAEYYYDIIQVTDSSSFTVPFIRGAIEVKEVISV